MSEQLTITFFGGMADGATISVAEPITRPVVAHFNAFTGQCDYYELIASNVGVWCGTCLDPARRMEFGRRLTREIQEGE